MRASFNPAFVFGPACALLACVVLAAAEPSFATSDNASNILGQVCVLTLLAVGQLVVMLCRGFDISVGAVAALSSTVGAMAFNLFGDVGFIAAPLAGAVVGLANGILVGYLGVQPIIATLGSLLTAKAVARLISSDGQVVVLRNADHISAWSEHTTLGVPDIAWWCAGLLVIVALALTRCTAGRRLFMVGSDPQAARLVGVPVERVVCGAYVVCGALAGAAGVVLAVRSGAGLPAEGNGLELQSIAAALIGGTALAGGVGRVGAVCCGALFIQIVLTGLNLIGSSPFAAQALLGLLIILSGCADAVVRGLFRRLSTGSLTP